MSSFAVNHPFEYAPHATRSLALALTLSLNLVLVLLGLLPSTRFPLPAPIPDSLQATILPPPPPVVPTLPVVKHLATPSVHIAIAPSIAPVAIRTLRTVEPVMPLQSTLPVASTNTIATAADRNATIAYETATPPAYPIQALRAGTQGTVLLKVLVDAAGKPVQVLIEHGSGSRLLDDAARRHVLAAWRFHPAIQNGQAIEAWVVVPVRFALNQG